MANMDSVSPSTSSPIPKTVTPDSEKTKRSGSPFIPQNSKTEKGAHTRFRGLLDRLHINFKLPSFLSRKARQEKSEPAKKNKIQKTRSEKIAEAFKTFKSIFDLSRFYKRSQHNKFKEWIDNTTCLYLGNLNLNKLSKDSKSAIFRDTTELSELLSKGKTTKDIENVLPRAVEIVKQLNNTYQSIGVNNNITNNIESPDDILEQMNTAKKKPKRNPKMKQNPVDSSQNKEKEVVLTRKDHLRSEQNLLQHKRNYLERFKTSQPVAFTEFEKNLDAINELLEAAGKIDEGTEVTPNEIQELRLASDNLRRPVRTHLEAEELGDFLLMIVNSK